MINECACFYAVALRTHNYVFVAVCSDESDVAIALAAYFVPIFLAPVVVTKRR